MQTTSHRAWKALAAIALASTALAGCNSGGSSSASSPSATASASAEDSATSSGGVTLLEKDSTSGDSSDSASASASASSSSTGGSTELADPAAPPAGYQTATAEEAGVTFAVPADWYVYTTLDETEINEMAIRLNADPTEIRKGAVLQDLVAMAPGPDAGGGIELLICVSIAFNLGVVDEATISKTITDDGGTVEKYSTVETANGTGSYAIYSEPDTTRKSALLYLPNPEGNMVTMTLATGSSERTQELIDNIAASLR